MTEISKKWADSSIYTIIFEFLVRFPILTHPLQKRNVHIQQMVS